MSWFSHWNGVWFGEWFGPVIPPKSGLGLLDPRVTPGLTPYRRLGVVSPSAGLRNYK